jgi:hypothetical protein
MGGNRDDNGARWAAGPVDVLVFYAVGETGPGVSTR